MIRNWFCCLILALPLIAGCDRGFGIQDVEECGNGLREATELCDGADLGGATCASLSLGEGTLGCTSGCLFEVSGCSLQATCGNGVAEFPEVCDATDLGGRTCESLGLGEGVLACDSDCTLDTQGCGSSTCGDLLVSGGEVCDGTELGGSSCRSLGYYDGDLACESDCSAYDTDGCGGRCGDGLVNGPELCDGQSFGADSCAARGFYSGSLQCASDCLSVDAGGCTGRCGDGITNGNESCDGEDVGGDTCENHGQVGTLLCLPDCSGVNLASCGTEGLLITEMGLGNPDWVELLNRSSASVDLSGWSLEWWGIDNNNQPVTGVLSLPAFSLGAGARVVVYDEYGGDPTAPPTVDQGAGTIVFHVNIWWGDAPGALALRDPQDAAVDFTRWGQSTIDPPTGIAWADTPEALAGTNSDDVSLSRFPDTQDTDVAGDFCFALASPGAPSGGCYVVPPPGALLINEVNDAQPTDRVELFNPGSVSVDTGAFVLYATNGTGTWQTLPAYDLGPGQLVAVVDDSTTGAYVDSGIIHVGNLNIAPTAGVVILMDNVTYEGVDFVRWGSIAVDPQAPDTWADTPAPIGPFPVGTLTPRSLGRSSATDTNVAGDFCFMEVTLGTANTACVP